MIQNLNSIMERDVKQRKKALIVGFQTTAENRAEIKKLLPLESRAKLLRRGENMGENRGN